MPVTGDEVKEYGGNTSCVFLFLGGQAIILDAGSGLLNVTPDILMGNQKLHMLLSHAHIDHIIGLPFADIMFSDHIEIDIYGAEREGQSVYEQLECLMSPPLWPVGFEAFSAKVSCHAVQDEFWLGEVRVRTMEATHPGGCVMYRLDYQDKSVVYATDNEMGEKPTAEFVRFAKGCTVLICDGQYSQEEYIQKVGFGHTRRDVAVETALQSECERFVIFHHDPCNTDEVLQKVQQEVAELSPRGVLAREGMVINL